MDDAEQRKLADTIAALAKHSWDDNETRKKELIDRGIEDKAQLVREIEKTLEDEKTKGFFAQAQKRDDPIQIKDAQQREIYAKPLDDQKSLIVILNHNRDPQTNELNGGTVMIRDNKEFKRLENVENRERRAEALEMGVEPREVEIVDGGRAALLEQQQQERTLAEQGMEAPAHEAEQVPTPAPQLQPAQKQQRETLRERMERQAKAAGITSRVIIENSNGREMGRQMRRTPWGDDEH